MDKENYLFNFDSNALIHLFLYNAFYLKKKSPAGDFFQNILFFVKFSIKKFSYFI